MMLERLKQLLVNSDDIGTQSGRAIIEERYWSIRKQVPVVYLLAAINLSGMELATSGVLHVGLNLPTIIAVCGVIRLAQWYHTKDGSLTHESMVARLRQTTWFAAGLCLLVCARAIQLLHSGDPASHMAVLLFGGLTAIGVAYGLTALPTAARIPLVLIAVPLAASGFLSSDSQFISAAMSLLVVAALASRLLATHNEHLVDLIKSRSEIARERELVENAHQDAIFAATTDFLTSLPNRRAFIAALEDAIQKGGLQSTFAVGLLDLDGFKGINDTFGHATGDKLLQEVATRLRRAKGPGAMVARLGGDEFGILFPEVNGEVEARLKGGKVLHHLKRPLIIDGQQIEVSGCCGFGISSHGDDRTPSRVLADADLALYQAKNSPEGIAVFEKRMEAPRRRRAEIERALQVPGVEQKIRLVFQPIVEFSTGKVVAHEALARWNDDVIGDVSPAEFVPIAERLNVIGGISAHLMAEAFAAAVKWPAAIKLSFNLSAIQLCSPGSAQSVLLALEAAGLPASRLLVEVTETALLADLERAKRNLAELRAAGVTIVLDDFGAGYASIGYLREIRFDQIKLDGALVTAAEHSSDGERLLRAVVGLCDILGVSTVAEHVESARLAKLLSKLGCRSGQGFWLHHPVQAEHLVGLRHIDLNAKSKLSTEDGDRRAA